MADASALPAEIRHDWSMAEVEQLFALPFNDLMFRAQSVHRAHFPANQVQLSTLLSIKTGGCPEDCGYCSQSAHASSGLKAEKLMDVDAVMSAAAEAKAAGSGRFCMGAAWREPKDRDLDALCEMVAGVKALGLETCMTLGMLSQYQADRLAAAGLDYYNHNLDTSPEYYGEIITTRTYQDRLDTLACVRKAGVEVCCGGIIGMGERDDDVIDLALALREVRPDSIPLNMLYPVEGTPLQHCRHLTPQRCLKIFSLFRFLHPRTEIRVAGGREFNLRSLQPLALYAAGWRRDGKATEPKRITFRACVAREHDDDNIRAAIKPSRDALVECGVIHDDKPSAGHTFIYEQEVNGKADGLRGVWITIESVKRQA